MKICFTASSGGHFEQLMMLKPIMEKHESFIITEKTKYQSSSLKSNIYYLDQVNRKEKLWFFKFIKNFYYTIKILNRERPDIIISTGALTTVSVCIIGKLKRKKIIFIESFAKINSQTLSGKIVYKFADLFIIQWEELKKFYPNAVFGGGIY